MMKANNNQRIFKLYTKFSNDFFKFYCWFSAFLLCIILFSIIYFVGRTGILTFQKVSFLTYFTSTEWTPETGKFGALSFIIGTLSLTGLTLILATPIAISIAVFLSEIAHVRIKKLIRPILDLLVGIPSIIYGHLGLTVLLPWLRKVFNLQMGDGLLAASLVLTLMVLPTITRLTDDALSFLPNEYREASYALGSTRFQLISRVLIPSARNGIITAVILGMARAIGETMAVVMVIGNVAQLPGNLFTPTSVLTSNIVMQITSVQNGTTWYYALYMMAFLLLLISLVLIAVIRMIRVKGSEA